jgi:murein DD-endopeptidase MepM/ murein hydrolase activator NlpD
MKIDIKISLVILSLLILIPGCASTPVSTSVIPKPPVGMPGTYHKIAKGETLWRVSRMYGVDLEELAQVNRIADATSIEVGQQIFIPNRVRPQIEAVKNSSNDDFIWPLRGRVSSGFGQTYNNMFNKGINIQPYSSTDIVASRAGKVVFLSDNFAGYGMTVIIDHQDGLFTVYARNVQVFVRPGDFVQKGSVIAKVGYGGRDRNIYLHFEVRRGHIPQNPLFYLP